MDGRQEALLLQDFYSRPCGRGDSGFTGGTKKQNLFLLTPLREGRLAHGIIIGTLLSGFLLTPLREGRQTHTPHTATSGNFYSRPCGRGDARDDAQREAHAHFYSRPCGRGDGRAAGEEAVDFRISTHAPAGGATYFYQWQAAFNQLFLLTPLREGRP